MTNAVQGLDSFYNNAKIEAMKECGKCGLCFADEAQTCPNDGTKLRVSLPGTEVLADRYRLLKRLGRGAMGQVYLARDENLGTREVAVKTVRQDILNSEDMEEGEAIARFEREAKSAASIRHPNVVDVTDFGESADGVFYLVMEYVEGETLHKLLRREGTLPLKRAVRILRQISDAVDAAHSMQIIHRDLKPANIFLMQSARGKHEFVKVGDFGLAKIINQTVTDTASPSTPSSRGIIGTPEFMAPEQMQPELGVDRRADLYAIGTIAYLMLAGHTPFTGDMMELVMQKVIHDAPPISSQRSDLPEEVQAVIMSTLEREPEKRPLTVSEWIDALEQASNNVAEREKGGAAKLTVLAPFGSEVYVDDERRGSIGRSGRLVLTSVPPGQHILRVSNQGSKDDERVIEVRESGEEQVIQAQFRKNVGSGAPSSDANHSGVGSEPSSIIPGIVACTQCGAKFAEGVQFCGKCGNASFDFVTGSSETTRNLCPRCSNPVRIDSQFCGKCGLNLTNTARASFPVNPNAEIACSKCGSKYSTPVKFCGHCGTAF